MGKLEVLLLKYEFQSALIFNMDETILDASGYKVKVFLRASFGRSYTEEEAKLKHITLGLCISILEEYVRPLAILSVKTLSQLNTQVQGFFSISSEPNGFIDNAIWYAWIRDIFIPHVNNFCRVMNQLNTHVLFLVDSHSTHKHKLTKKLFEDNNIIILVLPVHSSTILQPLDLTCNRELKKLLRVNFVVVKDEDSLTKCNILLYTSVYCLQLALRGFYIMNGFSRVEIHSFSKQALFNPTSFAILLQKSLFSLLLRRREIFLLLERFL
jgi:DDE superfamily endonuclease